MLMMLMAAGFWRKPLVSRCSHDAHGGGVLERAIGQLMLMDKAIGQLMLMMLMAAGFWRKPLVSRCSHDAHGGGVLERAIGQLMLMVAGQGSGESHWSADAHDAHGGGVLEKAIGQLMLMVAGFWTKPLAS